jgi:hypothetical protein
MESMRTQAEKLTLDHPPTIAQTPARRKPPQRSGDIADCRAWRRAV